MVNAEPKDQRENLDLRAQSVLLVNLVSEVLKVPKDQWDRKVHRVPVVQLVQWERLVK